MQDENPECMEHYHTSERKKKKVQTKKVGKDSMFLTRGHPAVMPYEEALNGAGDREIGN